MRDGMMPTTINFDAYKRLVEEDLEWLRNQPHSLENVHIQAILENHRDNRAYYDITVSYGDRLKSHD